MTKVPEQKKTQAPVQIPATKPVTPKEQGAVNPKDDSVKLTVLTTGFLRKKANFDRQHETMTKRLDGARANIARLEDQVLKTHLVSKIIPDRHVNGGERLVLICVSGVRIMVSTTLEHQQGDKQPDQ